MENAIGLVRAAANAHGAVECVLGGVGADLDPAFPDRRSRTSRCGASALWRPPDGAHPGGWLTCQGTYASRPNVEHWALARGGGALGGAPLLNPRSLAPLREQRTNGGAAPGPPHRCAHGSAAHRCGLRPRPAGGPGRLRPGRGPPAPQRRGAGQRGRERPRGAVTRCLCPHQGPPPSPARGGQFAFPQGSIARQARAGSDPEPRINRRMKRRVSGL